MEASHQQYNTPSLRFSLCFAHLNPLAAARNYGLGIQILHAFRYILGLAAERLGVVLDVDLRHDVDLRRSKKVPKRI